MRGGRLQPGSIMKWLAVGLAASPTKGWGRRRELGSLPMKVSSPERRSPSRARQRLRIRISRLARGLGPDELAARFSSSSREEYTPRGRPSGQTKSRAASEVSPLRAATRTELLSPVGRGGENAKGKGDVEGGRVLRVYLLLVWSFVFLC